MPKLTKPFSRKNLSPRVKVLKKPVVVEEETEKPVVNLPIPHPKPAFSYKKYLIPSLTFIVLLAGVGVGYSYFSNATKTEDTTQAAPLDQREIGQLVERVGKHIELPEGEQATIATVSDVTKLSGQVFFARAQNGDKVLIYSQAKKAILYRPSIDKIIAVGPVEGDAAQPEVVGASESAVPTTLKVSIYNGTTTTGLTRKVETTLLQMSSIKVEVGEKANAVKNTYQESIVVDLTGKNAQAAEQLAGVVKGQVGQLPEGEKRPLDTDLLIILGTSYTE